jgi:hypothetical protein
MEQTIKAIDGNSIKNQDIKSKFVAREIYCNVNSLVEYCLKTGYEDSESPVCIDDIENYYSYPEYYGKYANFDGGTESERDEEIERLRELQNEYDLDEPTEESEAIYDAIRDEIAELEILESEPREVYEWWAVSGWLFDKLKDKGQVVVDAGSCYVWGRQTSGQAILLDGVITRICSDLEILEGQSNEWK